MPNVLAFSYTRSCAHVTRWLRGRFARKLVSFVVLGLWSVAIFFGAYQGLDVLNKTGMSNESPKGSPSFLAQEAFEEGFPSLAQEYYAFDTLIVVEAKEGSSNALEAPISNFTHLLKKALPYGDDQFVRSYNGYFMAAGSDAARAGRPPSFYVSPVKGGQATLIIVQGSWGFGLGSMYPYFDALDGFVSNCTDPDMAAAYGYPDLSNYTVLFTGEIELLRNAKNQVIYDFEHADMYGVPLAWIILFFIVGAPAFLVFVTLPATILFSFWLNLWLADVFDSIQYPDFTPSVIVSIGVAMSIDYALFMITRYLSELKKGRDEGAALLNALSTAGRTVAVSGFIMFVSNAGLYFIKSKIVSSFGVGLAATNLVTIAVNITLLPALMELFAPALIRFERWFKVRFWACASICGGAVTSRARSLSDSISSAMGSPAAKDPLLQLDDDFGLVQLTVPLNSSESAEMGLDARTRLARQRGRDGSESFFERIKFFFKYDMWDWAGDLILKNPLKVGVAVFAIGFPVCFQVTFMKSSLSQDNMMNPTFDKQILMTTLMTEYGFPPGLGADYRAMVRPKQGAEFPLLGDPESDCADDDSFIAKEAKQKGFSGITSCAMAVQMLGGCAAAQTYGHFGKLLPYYCPSTCPEFCRANSTLSRPFFDYVASVGGALGNATMSFYNSILDDLDKEDVPPEIRMVSSLQYQESLCTQWAPYNASQRNRSVSFDDAKWLLSHDANGHANATAYRQRYHATTNYMRAQAMINFPIPFHPFGQNARLWVNDVRSTLGGLPTTIPGGGEYELFFGGGGSGIGDQAEAVLRLTPPILAIVVVATVIVSSLVAFRSLLIGPRLLLTVVFTASFSLGCCVILFQYMGFSPESGGLFWVVQILTVPIMLGLTLDYDIFLISRCYEHRCAGMSTHGAVIAALKETGPIITTAGCIMIAAFTALLMSSVPALQQTGATLICCCFIDTFFVRTFLVPSMMLVLVEWNWWPKKMPPTAAEYARLHGEVQHGAEKPPVISDRRRSIPASPSAASSSR